MSVSAVSEKVVEAARRLSKEVSTLTFADPVTHVYNPLEYAWAMHESYIRTYGGGTKKAVFLGMNPGPWGMAQTGIPFGEIPAVRDWMKLEEPVAKPLSEHPKRPVEGLACKRSEVSGRRLWGLFARRFGAAADFFKEHYVLNYCPLVFMEVSGKNRTPDKLPSSEVDALYAMCDRHLRSVVEAFQPRWVVGVGGFAEGRALEVLSGLDVKVIRILHPSPASPAANKDWDGQVVRVLEAEGVWSP